MNPAEIDAPQQLANSVGARIRAHRTERQWTLDTLAAASGVSRRQIINIEHGTVNPSIGMLLRLATGFELSLAALINEHSHGETQRAQPAVLWTGEHGGTGTLLASTAAPNITELWSWRMHHGESHHSEAHNSGTREIIHITEGALRMDVGDDSHNLAAGDSLVFAGDVPHRYVALAETPTQFTLAVHQPGVTV
ncbi:MAG: HTH-type transcriptional regulator sinR [Actinomycetota bacterium]|jgi:transcriptional regulator with XRE-family HTH domain